MSATAAISNGSVVLQWRAIGTVRLEIFRSLGSPQGGCGSMRRLCIQRRSSVAMTGLRLGEEIYDRGPRCWVYGPKKERS